MQTMEGSISNSKDTITVHEYNKTKVRIASFVHSFCGTVAIVAEVVKLTASANHKGQTLLTMGEGYYCGVVFMASAFAGGFTLLGDVLSAHRLKAFFILNMISSILGAWLVAVSGCIIYATLAYGHQPMAAMHFSLLFCGLVELFLGAFISSVGCRKCCACLKVQTGQEDGEAVIYFTEKKEFTSEHVDISGKMEDMVAKAKGYNNFP